MSGAPRRGALPPGVHAYETVVEDCRRGRLRFARVRAASGRLNWLIGVPPEALKALRALAKRRGVGLMVQGSRVSGPRLRQRDLHPALRAGLPLKTYRRAATARFPEVRGIAIEKTAIKEHGIDDPRTSDLTVAVVADLPRGELDAAAESLERSLAELGLSFPVRVYSHYDGRYHRDEGEFLETCEQYLRSLLPREDTARFSPSELREAMAELYFPVNLPRRRLLTRADLANGLLDAVLFTASFTISLRYHPSLPFMGFGFGLFGRYLARMRAAVAFELGDGLWANACAVAFDAALGVAIMGGLINPVARLGIAFESVVWGSFSHTLSKGALRLFLDKRFSTQHDRHQARGVLAGILLNFLQGLLTGFVYARAPWALALQGAMAALGLALLFGPPARERLRALGAP